MILPKLLTETVNYEKIAFEILRRVYLALLFHQFITGKPQLHARIGVYGVVNAAMVRNIAALTGYDAAIKETGRLTDEKIEMDEEALNILNMKFQILARSLDEEPEVTFTYFKPDEHKAGGAYIEVTGIVKKVDDFERLIVMQNGTKMPMDDILNIEGEIFASLQ